jgi:hypothetical protein
VPDVTDAWIVTVERRDTVLPFVGLAMATAGGVGAFTMTLTETEVFVAPELFVAIA